MKLDQRKKEILDILEKKQRVTVAYLSKTLYVSEMTIRRDLTQLEQSGFLKRYHGGALIQDDYLQYPIQLRMHINEKEKRSLAHQAEKHIKNGQTIFLPGSSTCSFLIPCLKNYDGLHVFTNSVQFMLMLAKLHIPCTLSGGEYYEPNKILIGRSAEAFFRQINFDLAFIACDGIADDGTISITNENTAEIVRIGIQNSAKRILLTDHSKLGLQCTYRICNTTDVDEVLVL